MKNRFSQLFKMKELKQKKNSKGRTGLQDELHSTSTNKKLLLRTKGLKLTEFIFRLEEMRINDDLDADRVWSK